MFLRNIWSSEADTDIGSNIPNSLMLDSSLSQYLSRTPTLGQHSTWTFSCWVKRAKLGVAQTLLSGTPSAGASSYTRIEFTDDDRLYVSTASSGVVKGEKKTTAILRDTSSYYHIVVCYDVGNSVASERERLYVNGVRLTAFTLSTDIPKDYGSYIFNGTPLAIGQSQFTGYNYYQDSYLASFIVVEGQALTPDSFGRFSADTGQWVPKNYTGTYGTNGFKLDFTNGTALGTDSSGNGNNWAVNGGITSANQYTDTPTNNFAVWNSIAGAIDGAPSVAAFSKGNTVLTGAASYLNAVSTLAATAGSYYAEMTVLGIAAAHTIILQVGNDPGYWCFYRSNGTSSGITGTLAPYTVGDIIGVCFSPSTGKVSFYKNNVLQGVESATITVGALVSIKVQLTAATDKVSLNFGARPFAYAPPAGFKALCTANLPTPAIIKPSKHFDALLHTGTGAARNVSGAGFKPDLAWVKQRNSTGWHQLSDSVRGTNRQLFSNDTYQEQTFADRITAFNSDGISVGTDASVNGGGSSYVDWLWKAGGSAVANNAGSIASQVSANVQAGFSIVTFTSPASGAYTVGHGLLKRPGLITQKVRSRAGTSWVTWHKALADDTSKYLELHATSAATTLAGVWGAGINSATFGQTVAISTGATEPVVAYCFAEIEGYSKIGSYTGNGSADGQFVYCGFKPRFVMIKRTDVAGQSWIMLDTVRDTTNPMGLDLYANLPNAEAAEAPVLDVTTTGFKHRNTYVATNASGGTYIFLALAEAPTKYATAR